MYHFVRNHRFTMNSNLSLTWHSYCCKCIFRSVQNISEYSGHNQFLEIPTASKEVVLSFCDFLLVLTNHPTAAFYAILYLSGNIIPFLLHSGELSIAFLGSSLMALLFMNLDRYLATYYPIYHRTSITKGRLLALPSWMAICCICCRYLLLDFWRTFVISYQISGLIFLLIFVPPMLFMKYKLFAIATKKWSIIRYKKDVFVEEYIKSLAIAVAWFLVLFISSLVYIRPRLNSKKKELTLDDAHHLGIYAKTILAQWMEHFNCLIFYWKNKILRLEGMKFIKAIYIYKHS